MKRFSVFLAMLVLVLLFGLAFVGCDNGSNDGDTPNGSGNANVVGRWVGTGEMYGSSITFNSDNTCTFSAFGTILLTGTYSVSGKTVNITTNGETLVATVTGNTMDFGGNIYTRQ